MTILETPAAMQAWAQAERLAGRTLACVPTMGYLHDGHLALVDAAAAAADRVVLTLFVNPRQFGPREDFARYPRDVERDTRLCRERRVDALFLPDRAAMYAPDHSVDVDEDALSRTLCGASRPGHFRGVCTVVAKLFNCTLPHVAVFGQKDAQQVAVIRRMIRDLNFPVRLIVVPTLREPDGLAMSSRNANLTPDERRRAVALSQALVLAQGAYAAGERDAAALRERLRAKIEDAGLRVDYVATVDGETLAPAETLAGGVLVALAAFAGATRLIDNARLDA